MAEIRTFLSKLGPYFYRIVIFIGGGLFTGGMAFIVQGRAFGFENVPLLAVTPAFFVGAISAAVISYLVLQNRDKLLGRINAEKGISAKLQNEITERERTENALRESEERYRLLIERSPDAVFVHIDGKVVFVNPAMMNLMGAESADQIVGMDAINIPHPEYREQVKKFRPDMFTKNKPIKFVALPYLALDGQTIHTEAGANLIKWGGKDAFMIVARNISDRVEADEKLRESEERYRDLIEGSDLGIQIGTQSKGRQFTNRACADLFGYGSVGALLEIPSGGLIAEKDKERISKYSRDLYAGNFDSLTYEFDGQKKDGSNIPIQVFAQHILWNGENAIQRTFIDLTDRKRAEEQLRQSQKMEAVGQLTGGIAHEFNNLLMVIVGNLERTADQVTDEKARKSLSSAMNGAMRAAELTHQLLSFSRKQALRVEHLDLSIMVRNMRGMLQKTLGETVSVDAELSDGIWPVLADRSLLESSLLNLMLNARDAMPKGGKITITTTNRVVGGDLRADHPNIAPGDYVLLEVADTGTGIAPKDLEHVFEPFFTTKGVGEGTGLGLSMVHGFVEQSGGFVDIESQLGKGTSFRVYLPRAAESAVNTGAGEHRSTQVPLISATVLVVEDDPTVRKIVVGILSELGYDIIEAEDGKTALSALASHPDIDVLFTDVVLPEGMSGPDIAGEARQKIPGLKVVFTSGYPDQEVNEFASDSEQPWFLRKPYRKSEIAELFNEVLQS